MLSCSIWFSAPSFWMGGGLESRCVGRVYGVDGAGTTHPKTRCRIPYAATQHLMLLMMRLCIRNTSSLEYINKLTCCIKFHEKDASHHGLHL